MKHFFTIVSIIWIISNIIFFIWNRYSKFVTATNAKKDGGDVLFFHIFMPIVIVMLLVIEAMDRSEMITNKFRTSINKLIDWIYPE